MIHKGMNQTGYEVISENPTILQGFVNNPAKVAKFRLYPDFA